VITTHTAQKVQNEGGHLQCLRAAAHFGGFSGVLMSVWATLALAIGNQLKGSAQHQKPKTKQQTPNGAVQ